MEEFLAVVYDISGEKTVTWIRQKGSAFPVYQIQVSSFNATGPGGTCIFLFNFTELKCVPTFKNILKAILTDVH